MIYRIFIRGDTLATIFETSYGSEGDISKMVSKTAIRGGLPPGCRMVDCYIDPDSDGEYAVLEFSDRGREESQRILPSVIEYNKDSELEGQ